MTKDQLFIKYRDTVVPLSGAVDGPSFGKALDQWAEQESIAFFRWAELNGYTFYDDLHDKGVVYIQGNKTEQKFTASELYQLFKSQQ